MRLCGITKRFGEVIACHDISLDLRAGEVHCLLGENGAGKSTLISILAGLQQADGGTIEIDGHRQALASPAEAIERGIAVVQQHSTLVPTMTVLDNLMLASGKGFWLKRRDAERQLHALRETLGSELEPGQLPRDLSLGQQQQFEIARAVRRQPRVLILDEATSMLTDTESDALMRTVRTLALRGACVLFVTHKLGEAFAVADSITVLREGRVVDYIDGRESVAAKPAQREKRVLDAMFGHEDRAASDYGQILPAVQPDAQIMLSVDRLSTAASDGTPVQDITLRVRAGEVLGIAGIDGHGQRHLAETIAGQRKPIAGRVLLAGQDITRESVKFRQRLGVRYLTDDRVNEGIIGGFSVALNLLLKRIGERPIWRFGRTDQAALKREAQQMVEAYEIRPPSVDVRAGALSGGNVQKLLLARELANDPRVVVFYKPSYGLDARTVRRVHEAIARCVSAGAAVLLISSDLDEITGLSHRIAILSSGRIVGEVPNSGAGVREAVGQLMVEGVRQ